MSTGKGSMVRLRIDSSPHEEYILKALGIRRGL